MLARPGWAGSGMNAAPWWKHAVIYRVDPRGFGGLHGLSEHLDYVHSIGVDAILLTSLGGDATQPIATEVGSMDDLGEVIRNASQQNIRVLVELDGTSPDVVAKARLWLAQGVAGFYAAGANVSQLADLRRNAAGFVGQRVVIGDRLDDAHGTDAPQLAVDKKPGTQEKLDASLIRPALEAAQQEAGGLPILVSDGPSSQRSASRYGDAQTAKALAAMLMTTRAGTMLFYGQELGLPDGTNTISFAVPTKKGEKPAPLSVAAEEADPSSLLNWCRQLSAMMHSNHTVSSGTMTMLNHDDQNVLAWIRKPTALSYTNPAVVVVENLSSQPVTVSLKGDMQKLGLKGSFLKPLLRSDIGMGAMHLEGMTLAPHAVFIGHLLY